MRRRQFATLGVAGAAFLGTGSLAQRAYDQQDRHAQPIVTSTYRYKRPPRRKKRC